jgi:hypothetical protein
VKFTKSNANNTHPATNNALKETSGIARVKTFKRRISRLGQKEKAGN